MFQSVAARSRFALMALMTLLVAPLAAAGASPRTQVLVSTAWLAEHIADPDLVLFHVGAKEEYEAAHLPGARLVTLHDVSVSSMEEGGLMLQMPEAEDLQKRLETIGVSNDSRVVVYWGKDWISPATRILFTLDYAGLGERVSILDGGQPLWTKEGRQVTAAVPETRAGKLSPLAIRSKIVDGDFVEAHRGKAGFAIVDARDPEFYTGASSGGDGKHPHLRGHVTGAKTFPFTTLVDDGSRVLSDEELAKRFREAGVAAGDTVVVYCHIGQQATATILAARLAGHETRLYDGSFEDWSRRKGAAVEATVPEPAKP